MKIIQALFLISLLFQIGCRKGENPCAKKEVKYNGQHLVDISTIASDKTIMDYLANYQIQVTGITNNDGVTQIDGRPIYKNLVIFNNTYSLSKTIKGGVTTYHSDTTFMDGTPVTDITPTISITTAKSIAEKELPQLGCYTYELGINDSWDKEYTKDNHFVLVYMFKSNSSEAYIAVNAKTGVIMEMWDGVTQNRIAQGFIRL